MALRHSTGLRNKILDSGLADAFDTNGRVNIYTGTQPSAANDAASGTLLATLVLSSDSMGSASSGTVAFNSITSDSSADATGTAGYFRVYRTGDTAPDQAAASSDRRLDGNITATGGGGDMTFDSTSFVAGGVIAITSFSYTYPT